MHGSSTYRSIHALGAPLAILLSCIVAMLVTPMASAGELPRNERDAQLGGSVAPPQWFAAGSSVNRLADGDSDGDGHRTP
jgi:multidrug efflux pump subunit AcrB